MDKIWLALITGITTGGISCFAIQGGLLASSFTPGDKKNWQKTIAFIGSKAIAYALLGALLGALGSAFALTPKIQAILQVIIAVFLLGTAARLLNFHPIFRYFSLQPPSSFYRLAKKSTKLQGFISPILLGFFALLLPCGVTQAMMLLALSTGSPALGAGIMFAFVIGTSPVFFTLGLAAAEIFKRKSLSVIAACVIAISGIISLNSAMVLFGSVHTLQNYYAAAKSVFAGSEEIQKSAGTNSEGVQEATINVTSGGYTTDVQTLKVGIPVKLTLITNNVASCSRAFTIPSMNISKLLPTTGTETLEFTPTKTGRLGFSCSMGMYTGSFNIIN
jgi:sulfite exporter TauE/SafE